MKKCFPDENALFSHFDIAFLSFGMYDIVPIEADVEHLSRYDYLIFLGWNSMTEENMDKLAEYVRRGGHLLMSAAHLNASTVRGGEYTPVSNDKIKSLFGCELTGLCAIVPVI